MKKALYFLLVEFILCLIIILSYGEGLNSDTMTELGLVNLILGVIGLIIGVIFLIVKVEKIANPLLISSGLLLLIGFLTCSVFPFR